LGPATLYVAGGPPTKFVMKRRSLRSSTAAASSLLKSERIRLAVSWPTATANPHRITKVSADDVSARRQRTGMRSSTQDVPRAADRVQQPRLAVGLELATHVRDEDLDGVRRRERVVAPHLLQKALARDDDALVAHEVLEELELALRQLDLAGAAADLVRVGVQRQVADDEGRRAAGRAAAQQRA
jgi:hypothetical protein